MSLLCPQDLNVEGRKRRRLKKTPGLPTATAKAGRGRSDTGAPGEPTGARRSECPETGPRCGPAEGSGTTPGLSPLTAAPPGPAPALPAPPRPAPARVS